MVLLNCENFVFLLRKILWILCRSAVVVYIQASINKHALQLLILALTEIANVVNVYICDSILWSVS